MAGQARPHIEMLDRDFKQHIERAHSNLLPSDLTYNAKRIEGHTKVYTNCLVGAHTESPGSSEVPPGMTG